MHINGILKRRDRAMSAILLSRIRLLKCCGKLYMSIHNHQFCNIKQGNTLGAWIFMGKFTENCVCSYIVT